MDDRRKIKGKCHERYKEFNEQIKPKINQAKEEWLHKTATKSHNTEWNTKSELYHKINATARVWKPKKHTTDESNSMHLNEEKQKEICYKYVLNLFSDYRPT